MLGQLFGVLKRLLEDVSRLLGKAIRPLGDPNEELAVTTARLGDANWTP